MHAFQEGRSEGQLRGLYSSCTQGQPHGPCPWCAVLCRLCRESLLDGLAWQQGGAVHGKGNLDQLWAILLRGR